ncbi:MAG: hypothetical protein ACPG7F_05180 [Aggregatilineales bacterium]
MLQRKDKTGQIMSTAGLVMTVIAAGMMGVSNLMLRAALDAMGGFGSSADGLLVDIFNLATQPLLIIGLGIYGAAMLLWLRVLSEEPLGISYPILVSLAFVIVSIGAVVVFKESVSPVKLLGVGVIVLGVIILSNG